MQFTRDRSGWTPMAAVFRLMDVPCIIWQENFNGMERIKKNNTRGMEFFNGESDIIHLWIYITGRMKGC